jgi:hypothetical protein
MQAFIAPAWPINFTIAAILAHCSSIFAGDQVNGRQRSQQGKRGLAINDLSLRFDPCRLDDRPPFLDVGLLQRAERLRRLLLAR